MQTLLRRLLMATNPNRVPLGRKEQVVITPDEGGAHSPQRARHEPSHHPPQDVAIPREFNLMRDRVRWGPILAGFLTALTSLLVLNLLGLAVGFTTVNAGTAAAQGG